MKTNNKCGMHDPATIKGQGQGEGKGLYHGDVDGCNYARLTTGAVSQQSKARAGPANLALPLLLLAVWLILTRLACGNHDYDSCLATGQVSLQCKERAGTVKLALVIVLPIALAFLLLALGLVLAVHWKQLLGDFAAARVHRIKRRYGFAMHACCCYCCCC